MFGSSSVLVRYLFDVLSNKYRTTNGHVSDKFLPEWEVIPRETWERPEEDKRKTRG